MNMPTSDPIWRALAAEAGVAADQMGEGATLLDKMTPEYSWTFARVFFPLSIGVERACKLALQVDSRLETGEFLDAAAMRRHGHQLDGLLTAVEAMASRRSWGLDRPDDPIHTTVVTILTAFATNGRYHHLDHLAGRVGGYDPARQWWEDVVIPVADRHYKPAKRAADHELADRLGSALDKVAITAHTHVAGHEITSMRQGLVEGALVRAVRPWTRVYVLQLARWIAGVMRGLTDASYTVGASEIPALQEFFAHFDVDDRYMRTRSTWRPLT